jgi:hypothetical protein
MKRISLLLLLTLALTLSACGDMNAENAAMTAVKENYQTALELYCAVYGAGLSVQDGYAIDPDGNAYSQYAPIAQSCRYQTTTQLREAIEAHFSQNLAAQLCKIAFGDWSGESDATGQVITARYRDVDGKMQINLVHTARFAEKEAMLPDFATLAPVSSATRRVTLEVTMHPSDNSRTYRAQWILLLENGAWKFDTAPYVSVDAVEEID